MLIIEASGDVDRFGDRLDAVALIAQEYPKLPIKLVHSDKLDLPVGRAISGNVEIIPSGAPYRQAARFLAQSNGTAVLVSAGDTGQVVAAVGVTIGFWDKDKTPPVLASLFPKQDGRFVFLDVGGGLDLTTQNLTWGALTGRVVAKAIFGKQAVKVGLLNIGEEKGKGGAIMEDTRQALQELLGTEFIGNIEFNHAVKSDIDVLVTSGFVGNANLKAIEAMMELQSNKVKSTCKQKPYLYPLAFLFKGIGKLFLGDFRWQHFAGAYLLGVKKPVVVTHGRCDETAFYNSIKRGLAQPTLEIWHKTESDPLIAQYLKS